VPKIGIGGRSEFLFFLFFLSAAAAVAAAAAAEAADAVILYSLINGRFIDTPASSLKRGGETPRATKWPKFECARIFSGQKFGLEF